MKHFGVLFVVFLSLGLLSGCGAAKFSGVDGPSPGSGQDGPQEGSMQGEYGEGGHGVDRFNGSSYDLNGPNWRGGIADFDVNVEPLHRVFFDFNSALINAGSAQVLAHNAGWIRAHRPQGKITIEGHCDERGTREYNLALGQQRAEAVRKFLVSQGVNPKRLSVISYGKERPLVWGHDDAAWDENRRAEIVLP